MLNPILAKVDLTLNVLSYFDLKVTNPGYTLFMAYQITKEIMQRLTWRTAFKTRVLG